MVQDLPFLADPFTAGVDEAGRGPLAGPVVAAAVILSPEQPIDGLRDSKKLTARRRAMLAEIIRNRALAFAVASASVEEIDRLNILQATMLAMTRAVNGLQPPPRRVRIDGNRAPRLAAMQVETVIGGDRQDAAIAAASILAKTVRDQLMAQYASQFPAYGFDRHAGYGTAAHLAALRAHGPCEIHRRSFAPVARVLGGGG
ncbi:MAG: ribonuclease HII [Lautropia sp.]|nr:ribonuclease HII [Lautropia sp.]